MKRGQKELSAFLYFLKGKKLNTPFPYPFPEESKQLAFHFIAFQIVKDQIARRWHQ
jgi:hypothetical protein